MRRNSQLVVHHGHGDCLRACLTSILDIPNSLDLPNVDDKKPGEWFLLWRKWLGQYGLVLNYEIKAFWREGFWIASVPSLNFPGGRHAIVMNGSDVEWDPSPLKRYDSSMSLTGEGRVFGGHYLEVSDASLLRGLVALQERERTSQGGTPT